jgi:hypothetical protein
MLKPFGVIGASALFLLVGSAVPVGAWQEKQEEKSEPARQEQEAKPEKQQQANPEKQPQAKAPQQQEEAKPAKQPQAQAPKPEQQAKPEKQQQAKAPQAQKPQQPSKPAKQEQRQATSQKQPQQKAASSQRPQRTQQAIAAQRAQPALRLSARGNSRIPDDRFKASFGAGHDFHMGNPVMVGGYSRFQYSGFWFGFVEPWPVGWYYTDAVYIDYVDGGYYMFDPYYPGARFAISVVL